MRVPAIVMLAALAAAMPGCASSNASGKWPSLEPRPGEISPLVPRTPLGACANCGADVFAAAPVPPPLPPQPVPADASTRVDAVAKVIAAVEADYPAQLALTQRAVAAGATNGDAEVEAEVQRSRLEATFLPLSAQSQILDTVADDLIGKADTAALEARIAGLRTRIAKLEAVRAAAGL